MDFLNNSIIKTIKSKMDHIQLQKTYIQDLLDTNACSIDSAKELINEFTLQIAKLYKMWNLLAYLNEKQELPEDVQESLSFITS